MVKELPNESIPEPIVAAVEVEEEITDIKSFQSSLNDSLNVVKSLVESWLPKDLDANWNTTTTSSSSFSSTSLNSKLRPPRLGLGANETKFHIQQAADTKLRNQLLSKGLNGGKKRAREEVLLPMSKGSASASDSEGESRSKSIKKSNGTSGSNIIRNGATPSLIITTSNKNNKKKSLPSTNILHQEISPSSFYSNGSTPSTSTLPTSTSTIGLSKNQRKKERDRLKLQETKRIKLEESLAASASTNHLDSNSDSEEEEPESEESEEDDSTPFPSPKKLKDKRRDRIVKPPFAPLDSSSGGEGTENDSPKPILRSTLVPIVLVRKEEVDSDNEMMNGTGGGEGEGGEKKKKKRRGKKSKKGGEGGGGSKPLLNLEARSESSP